MKGILIFEEKKRLLNGAKADLVLGLKKRQASILKYMLGQCLFLHAMAFFFSPIASHCILNGGLGLS